MMPRIQFSYDGGDGPDSEGVSRPFSTNVVQEAFCNPNNNCSPVCCCCGLLPIRIAVKGVVYISIVFSIWEVSMGFWLLIESYCCLEPITDESSEETPLGLQQLNKLHGAGWLVIIVGLFRCFGLIYLLYSVYSEERARKLPIIFCMSTSILVGLILMYPLFISIPGKGIHLPHGSLLKDFESAYTFGYTLDLLFLTFYSLYTITYFIIINQENDTNQEFQHCDQGRTRFEPIHPNIQLN